MSDRFETLLFVCGALCLAVSLARHTAPLGRHALSGKLLGGAALLAAMVLGGCYFRYMLVQPPQQWLHLHDFYHYYVGAKYYRELGHMRLYDCTHAAFAELGGSGISVPDVPFVRALDQPHTIRSGAALETAGRACRERFTTPRWVTFKRDLTTLLEHDASSATWRPMLADFGNNSPPSWNVVAGLLANLVALDRGTLIALPLLDQLLLVVLVPLLIARTLGGTVTLAYLLLFFANPLAGFGWTSGSYFRADWFAALVAALLALHTRRYASAGALFAIAAGCRVFPAAFALAAVIALVTQRPLERAALTRLIGAGLVVGALFAAAATFFYGYAAWSEFVEVVRLRINPYGNNSIGLVKVAAFYNVIEWPSFSGGADALAAMMHWLQTVRHDALDVRAVTLASQAALLLAAGLAVRHLAVMPATVVLGTVLVFVLLAPFTYYYVFLAALALAALGAPPTLRAPLFLICALGVAGLRVMSVRFQLELGFEPGYFSVSYQQSRVLLLMLLGVLAALAVNGLRRPAAARAPRVFDGAALVMLVAILIAALSSLRLQPYRNACFIDLSALGAWHGENIVARRRSATASWPRHGYYEFAFNPAARAVDIELSAVPSGRYRVTLLSSHGGGLGGFSAALAGHRTDIALPPAGNGAIAPLATELGRLTLGPGAVLRLSDPLQAARGIGVSGLVLEPVAVP